MDLYAKSTGEELADLVDCYTGLMMTQVPTKAFWSGFENTECESMGIIDFTCTVLGMCKLTLIHILYINTYLLTAYYGLYVQS